MASSSSSLPSMTTTGVADTTAHCVVKIAVTRIAEEVVYGIKFFNGTEIQNVTAPIDLSLSPKKLYDEQYAAAYQERLESIDALVGVAFGVLFPLAIIIFLANFRKGRYSHWIHPLFWMTLTWSWAYVPLVQHYHIPYIFTFGYDIGGHAPRTCDVASPNPVTCAYKELHDWLTEFWSTGSFENFNSSWLLAFPVVAITLLLAAYSLSMKPGDEQRHREKLKRRKLAHQEAHRLGMEIMEARRAASKAEKGGKLEDDLSEDDLSVSP